MSMMKEVGVTEGANSIQYIPEDADCKNRHGESIASESRVAVEQSCEDLIVVLWRRNFQLRG